MPGSLAPLGQSAIEVSITAVNENVLPGDMGRLRRDEKQRHGGDFVRPRHAFAQWYFRDNVRELFFGIRKCADPLLVKRREDFGGNDGVHPNSQREQLRGPVASERKYRAFG